MSKQNPLPIWYRFFIDDLIDLRAMNHPDDIHYKAARMDGYISGLLMSDTIIANECDQLRAVLDNATSHATAQISPHAISVNAVPAREKSEILSLAENIRDHLDALDTEITFLSGQNAVSLKPLDDLHLQISIEVDNICRACLPSPQLELLTNTVAA